jgi:pimeloyl-ACP methyl ester carboxylesterase
VDGDPRYAAVETRLAGLPRIDVPAIAMHGAVDGVTPLGKPERHAAHFGGRFESRVLDGVGHNPPQEAPDAFARAILDVRKR